MINTQSTQHSIAILLCTYNGSHFLQEQLDSFSAQNQKHWKLFVYDDASTDNTCELISQYQSHISQPVYLQKNNASKGFCKNFLSAICATPNDSADFFALSDQDDIWQADKLSRAITYLNTLSPNIPAVYCSRTQLVDNTRKPLGFSPLFKKKPSFKNALVQSIAGGNTMVLNRAAKALITQAGFNIDVVSHDWWIYLLISGAGGHIFYDSVSSILYRQHGNNLVGANNTLSAKFARFKRLLKSEFKQWNDNNIIALNANRTLLQPHNMQILDYFIEARESTLLKRCLKFYQSGIYRQTVQGNIALIIAVALNKI